jgi:hypothetical protein
MREKIRIVGVALAVILLILTAYIYIMKKKNNSNAPQENTQFTVPEKGADKFTIKTSKGDVDVQNIYKNSLGDLSQSGVAFEDNDEYYIAYYPEDQGFIIALESPNIQNARTDAEKDFLDTLGITQEQACKLKVSLTVPMSVNAKAAGGNYGLSFCPDGKPLP